MSTCIVCGRDRSSESEDVHWLHEPDCSKRFGGDPGEECDCDVVACDPHCPECASGDASALCAGLNEFAVRELKKIASEYFKACMQPWLDANGGLGFYMVYSNMAIMSKDGNMFKAPYWMEEVLDQRVLGMRFGNMMPAYLPWIGNAVENLDVNAPA